MIGVKTRDFIVKRVVPLVWSRPSHFNGPSYELAAQIEIAATCENEFH